MLNAAAARFEDPDRMHAHPASEWARLGDDVARAVGIVAAQAGCPAERALGLMRACFELTDRTLREIAVAVIDRDLRFDRAPVSLIRCAGRVDQLSVRTDLRAVVECLLTAHYSEQEIVDYLTGPIGVSEADAVRAMRDCTGTGDLVGLGEAGNPA